VISIFFNQLCYLFIANFVLMNIVRLNLLRIVFGIIFVISGSINVYSQSNSKPAEPKSSFADRLYFGGALGLSIGSYSSLIDLSPIVGYALTDDFIVGIGLTYKYYRYKDYYALLDDNGQVVDVFDFKTNMYGGSIWARYFLTKTEIPVIENLFLHGEVEPLTFVNNYKYSPSGNVLDRYGNRYVEEKERINMTGVFLGGGLSQPVGGRSYMYIEVLWDFNEELYSPYSNPRIRIGFAAGF